jgi:hypothetical protein
MESVCDIEGKGTSVEGNVYFEEGGSRCSCIT